LLQLFAFCSSIFTENGVDTVYVIPLSSAFSVWSKCTSFHKQREVGSKALLQWNRPVK